MLKKTIVYTDYEGVERTDDFYFNLNKAEITEMEFEHQGGLMKLIKKITVEEDSKKIMTIFKDLILRSYGEKSPDGKKFVKNQELRDSFSQTEAYSELFMELATDAEAAAVFVNGITPPAPTKTTTPKLVK